MPCRINKANKKSVAIIIFFVPMYYSHIPYTSSSYHAYIDADNKEKDDEFKQLFPIETRTYPFRKAIGTEEQYQVIRNYNQLKSSSNELEGYTPEQVKKVDDLVALCHSHHCVISPNGIEKTSDVSFSLLWNVVRTNAIRCNNCITGGCHCNCCPHMKKNKDVSFHLLLLKLHMYDDPDRPAVELYVSCEDTTKDFASVQDAFDYILSCHRKRKDYFEIDHPLGRQQRQQQSYAGMRPSMVQSSRKKFTTTAFSYVGERLGLLE
jgi:hypothetical protein